MSLLWNQLQSWSVWCSIDTVPLLNQCTISLKFWLHRSISFRLGVGQACNFMCFFPYGKSFGLMCKFILGMTRWWFVQCSAQHMAWVTQTSSLSILLVLTFMRKHLPVQGLSWESSSTNKNYIIYPWCSQNWLLLMHKHRWESYFFVICITMSLSLIPIGKLLRFL